MIECLVLAFLFRHLLDEFEGDWEKQAGGKRPKQTEEVNKLHLLAS